MTLPTQFYVYLHVDPSTNEVVYVGKGTNGRAWDVTRCRTENSEHQDWMLELCSIGHTPDEWVVILEKGLSEVAAFKLEKEYFHTHGRPRFNRTGGEKNHQSKLTDQQARDAYLLCHMGMRQKDVAEEFGVSRTAISMITTGKQWKSTTADIRRQLHG